MKTTAALAITVGAVVLLALTALAGCSSPSQSAGSGGSSTQLTGTMDQWVNAVCEHGGPTTPVTSGRYMTGATNPMTCLAIMDRGNEGQRVPIMIGTYPSQSQAENDLGGELLGPYAEGNDGTNEVVFATISPSAQLQSAESAMFHPLVTYGFTVHPSPHSLAEPQVPAPPPTYTDAMPPSRPTPTAPPSTSSPTIATAQPYWNGPWLRNFSEDENCTGQGLDYWVVQPGDDSDMYALKNGCLSQTWLNAISAHCQSEGFPPGGRCAVWDQDRIMSTLGKHGDLLIVALAQACLNRAGLTDFHEGPIHQDCVEHR